MSSIELKDFKKQLEHLSFSEQLSIMEFLAKIMKDSQEKSEKSKIVLQKKRQFGSAKGKFVYPVDFDEDNEEIAKLFGVL